jgi:hypothetical protein
MKPKWQRARITNSDNVGREFWVEAGPPVNKTCKSWRDSDSIDAYTGTYPVFITNIVYDEVRRAVINAKDAELLPDFAEDVPLIPWEEFLANARERQERRPDGK